MKTVLKIRLLAVAVVGFALSLATPVSATGLENINGCGANGQPACTIAKATKLGSKPSGCPRGSVFDRIDGGGCWSCPKHYVRGVTSVKSDSACVRGPYTSTAKAQYRGKAKGLLKTDCKKGYFWDPNGSCYSCPSGYARNGEPVTASNSCTKVHGPSVRTAKLSKSLACPKGFADSIDGGTCWSCPNKFGRTLAHVRAGNACAANVFAGIHPVLGACKKGLINVRGTCTKRNFCGSLGQRPCTVLERLPSCNAGLAEDFVAHRCVEDRAGEAICTATVNALWAGNDVSGLLSKVPKVALARAFPVPRNDMERTLEVIQAKAKREVGTRIAMVAPEAEFIMNWMNAPENDGVIRRLFSAKNLCSGTAQALDRMLLELGVVPEPIVRELGLRNSSAMNSTTEFFKALNPLDFFLGAPAYANVIPAGDPLDRHFYMGYELTLSAAKVGGAGVSLMGVTDFRGNGGIYLAPLLQVVTNITGDFDVRLVFFSSANMQTFEGFGFGLGASASIKKAISAGLDIILDDKVVVRGFGFGPGVGKGKLPGDVGVQGSYSWQLKRRCADTDPTNTCSDCSCLD